MMSYATLTTMRLLKERGPLAAGDLAAPVFRLDDAWENDGSGERFVGYMRTKLNAMKIAGLVAQTPHGLWLLSTAGRARYEEETSCST